MDSVQLNTRTWRTGQMQKIKEDPPVIHFRGNSKTKKHRLSNLQKQEAEKDIKEYESHHSGEPKPD
jgi:hypothetical protein